jgi:uncharacterized protein
MRPILFAVILVVACATVAAADFYEDAYSAYQRGDYALAARLFRSLAEQGNAMAQASLGVMYANGQGVQQDDHQAAKWYRKAAEQGMARAQFNVGVMYDKGQGGPQIDQEAVRWYRKAADQGHAKAQFNLGLMYAKGHGVPQDFVRAHMWFSVAAAALTGDDGKKAMTFRDTVASRMTAAQIEKSQEMAQRCQQSKFKECD